VCETVCVSVYWIFHPTGRRLVHDEILLSEHCATDAQEECV